MLFSGWDEHAEQEQAPTGAAVDIFCRRYGKRADKQVGFAPGVCITCLIRPVVMGGDDD